jgi:hypothetical protein
MLFDKESFNNALDEYENRKQKEFYDVYPLLFPKHPHWNTKREIQEPNCGFSCGYGWWPLLKQLCSDLTELINQSDLPEEDKAIPVHQIKEKFGGLLYYVGNYHESLDKKARELISKAEHDSFSICEECGSPGKLRSGSWLKTRCDCCQEKYENRSFK